MQTPALDILRIKTAGPGTWGALAGMGLGAGIGGLGGASYADSSYEPDPGLAAQKLELQGKMRDIEDSRSILRFIPGQTAELDRVLAQGNDALQMADQAEQHRRSVGNAVGGAGGAILGAGIGGVAGAMGGQALGDLNSMRPTRKLAFAALDIPRTKTAFWGGAIHGIMGLPYSQGQRAAISEAPQELTDAEYNHVTGGFNNAIATVPRAVGHSFLGAGAGALAGGILGGSTGIGLDELDSNGGSHTEDFAQGGAIGGAILGGLAGGAHGTYTAARDNTAENIEAVDTNQTVANRHPVAVAGGTALMAIPTAMNLGLNLPMNALMGGLGHGIEALRGRGYRG